MHPGKSLWLGAGRVAARGDVPLRRFAGIDASLYHSPGNVPMCSRILEVAASSEFLGSLAVTPDGRAAVCCIGVRRDAGAAGRVQLWNLVTGQLIRTLE